MIVVIKNQQTRVLLFSLQLSGLTKEKLLWLFDRQVKLSLVYPDIYSINANSDMSPGENVVGYY